MTHEFASPYTVTRQNGQEDAAALRYALQFASVRHSTHATVLREIADRIEEQLTPAIEEPQEFGSIVRAAAPHHHRALWTRSPMTGDHYWMSEKGYAEVWPELTDVEVLRVGLGDERPLQLVAEDAQLKGFVAGRYDAAAQIHYRLQTLLAEAITSERKNALEKAIQAVEELAP